MASPAGEITRAAGLGVLRFPTDTALGLSSPGTRAVSRAISERWRAQGGHCAGDGIRNRNNEWLRLPAWPAGCPSGCTITPSPLYLQPGLKLGFAALQAANETYEEYVSDPAKPVPYLSRPVQPFGYGDGSTWSTWLVTDQRASRQRVRMCCSFVSDKLTRAAEDCKRSTNGSSLRRPLAVQTQTG